MSDEIQETVAQDTVAVEATQTVVTETRTNVTEPVIDWDAAPTSDQINAAYESESAVTYRPPRGRWDFTNPQRVVLALLIWLNIIMFFIAYLAITGKLNI